MTKYLAFLSLILVTVALNAVAQTLLKLGSGQNPLNPYLLGGLMTYGVSTVFYIMVLGKLNLSIAYPVVIGLTIIATTFSGVMIFKEQVSLTQWIGVGLMLSGISAIAFGKIS
jgi:multidrug transporter EmrE-like cation transporter